MCRQQNRKRKIGFDSILKNQRRQSTCLAFLYSARAWRTLGLVIIFKMWEFFPRVAFVMICCAPSKTNKQTEMEHVTPVAHFFASLIPRAPSHVFRMQLRFLWISLAIYLAGFFVASHELCMDYVSGRYFLQVPLYVISDDSCETVIFNFGYSLPLLHEVHRQMGL